MIDYFKGIYGINLLFRVHGSALYKGCLVGFISTFIFLAIELRWNEHGRERDDDDDLDSPYAIGVLVSSVTFLIIFRANYGYQRYWEACVSETFPSKREIVAVANSFHMNALKIIRERSTTS